MNIHPIRTKKNYETALKEIERLFDVKPNTPSGDKLDILTTLVEVYEEEHYPINFPDAVDVLHYWMEAKGLERKVFSVSSRLRFKISDTRALVPMYDS